MSDQAKGIIAVIDDSADIRLLCKQALKMEGREAAVFENGLEALGYLRAAKHSPSLIFADLSMPQMSGSELITEIRKDPGLKNMRIIITSGWRDLAKRAAELGADGYLAKPFGLDQFYETIERHENSPSVKFS